MYVIGIDKQVDAIHHLLEGNSIRATARLTGIDKDTVMRLAVTVGDHCAALHNRVVRGVNVNRVEVDEIWTFIHKKQGHLEQGDHWSFGDQYTFLALATDEKLMISFLTGKRNGENTNKFIADLRSRVLGRIQLSSDGWEAYIGAIDLHFARQVDYGRMIKTFESTAPNNAPAAHRYSPGRVIAAEREVIFGSPDEDKINTSYAERANLSVRMHCRRLTRLTNAFSKKFENLRASIALYIMFYNFVRVHETLRITPAMAAGLSRHVWSVRELIEEAMAENVEGDPYGTDRAHAA